MDKKELRKVAKERLNNIDSTTRKRISNQIVHQLISSDLWKQADTIGVTVSSGFEWDTEPIIEQGWQEGKTIVVPKCTPENRQLDFYHLENFDQLEESFYNLREPNPARTTKVNKQAINLLIVPGLLYDKRGYRIGFGGGYYVRFLTDFQNKTVSIFYSEQLLDEVPSEPYDLPVQALLTEKGFVEK